MELIFDLKSVCQYVVDNPGLKWLALPKQTLQAIRDEMDGGLAVKRSPRPTYGPPFGDIDRLLWDGLNAMLNDAPIVICGVKVIEKH